MEIITPKGQYARFGANGQPMTATLQSEACSWHLYWEDGEETNLWRSSSGNFSWPEEKIIEMVCAT